MYKASRALTSIKPEELDQYLSRGWFRMDQSVFSSQFLQDDDFNFRDLIWLRHRLSAFQFPKWFRKMKKDDRFSVYISDAHPTATHEVLYQHYRESKPESWPKSLEDILFGEKSENVFNTKVINIWCGEELVAAGFFDLGLKSAAGIVNFYNPNYSRYSLGKYLYYLTAEFAINEGLEFFYPGYVAPGNPHLDYKLTMDKNSLEFFHSIYEAWYPYRLFKEDHLSLPLMERKLSEVYLTLEDMGIQVYSIRNANYEHLYNSKWDSPYALYIVPTDPRGTHFAITYDVNTRRYYIFDCTERNWIDDLRVIDDKLVCYETLGLCKPIADEYHFSNTIKRLHDLIEL
jgi:arginine-tRNA-protein transferase